MKYVDYNNMKEFYTIDEVCRLLEIEKIDLRKYAEEFQGEPGEDQFGIWGFPEKPRRKLHNKIYHAQRENGWDAPIWNDSPKRGPWD